MKALRLPVLAGIVLALFLVAPVHASITYDLGANETIWLQFDTPASDFNGMTLWWNWSNGPTNANVDWSIYTTEADNGSYYDQMDAWFLPANAFDPLLDSTMTLMFQNVGTQTSTLTLQRFETYNVDAPYTYDEWCDAVYPESNPPGLVWKVEFTSSHLYTSDPGGYNDLFYYDPLVSHQVYRSDFKQAEVVPVPASVVLLASGFLAFIGLRRKTLQA